MSADGTLDNIVVKPKRFQCTRCQRRFARLEHLQRHERTHTRERPFSCKQCDSRFTRSDLLIRHERLSHRGPGTSLTTTKSPPLGNLPVADNDTQAGEVWQPSPSPTSVLPAPPSSIPGTAVDYSLAPLLDLGGSSSSPGPFPETSPQRLQEDTIVSDPLTRSVNAAVVEPEHAIASPSATELFSLMEPRALASYRLSPPLVTEESDWAFRFDEIPSILPQAEVEGGTLSEFCSRLPSVEPSVGLFPRAPAKSNSLSVVTSDDRQLMLQKTAEFGNVIPNFRLPTALSLGRYIRGYVDGFHEHLPFLHMPSMSIQTCSIELLLAMAAVGAQYCFEPNKGVELFHASKAIAIERIRRRDLGLVSFELPSGFNNTDADPVPGHDLMESAQALLILMAMATWGKHSEILREPLAIQSILASLVRENGLRAEPPAEQNLKSWEAWMRYESVLRTKFIVFCFFNLHCIVYDIPPLILNSELQMRLPCSAAEFKADAAGEWQHAREQAEPPWLFQDAMRSVFSDGGRARPVQHSSLGNYVLIHAVIQHMFLLRQTSRCRVVAEPATQSMASLERVLVNWQLNWERSPESSLDPGGPQGPVAFNSTALLRLAYVRLAMDMGPKRALGTRDPAQIATALREIPVPAATLQSPNLTRALFHSAHALSIPIKIGIRLVAKTQTFVWSIQHSLCSLECAILLSKWLESVSSFQREGTRSLLTNDERRILDLVKTMLDETDFGIPDNLSHDASAAATRLSIGVVKAWATIFSGSQTWAMVDVIGTSLHLYADLLEATSNI